LCGKEFEHEINFVCGLCGWLELNYYRENNSIQILFKCQRCGHDSVFGTYLSKTHLMMDPMESTYDKWKKDGMPGVISLYGIADGDLILTCKRGHNSYRNFGIEANFRCEVCDAMPVNMKNIDGRTKIELRGDIETSLARP